MVDQAASDDAHHVKASIRIADELRRRIANGDLLPGDALPSENDLVDEHGYSRPTVREALRILENEGLIHVKRGLRGGPEVRALSIAKVAQPMGVYLQVSDVPVADVWASRDRIIGAAIDRLASGPDVDLAPLQEQVDSLVAHVGDVSSFYLRLISTSEAAVELAGSATDHVVVTALRHIIETELAAATEAVHDMEVAVAAEQSIADSWRTVLRHIRGGRRRAARTAFEQQARILQSHFEGPAGDTTVGESARATPEQRVSTHAARFRTASGGH